jgi:maltooligosyltrehalose trehalohydrolase
VTGAASPGKAKFQVISPLDVPLGARYSAENGCTFLVWAPKAEKIDVHILSPTDRVLPMQRLERGYFYAHADDVGCGAQYTYRLNDLAEHPDPASRFQPQGVHGPSQLIDDRFPWSDAKWKGVQLQDYVLYELHVGTFTPEGTFDAIVPRIAELSSLGITAIEIMPVAQFPGSRNWGYDGVYPHAAQDSYGGAEGLKRLVDACHAKGMAVVLDVVYNHLGPEGNYAGAFGYYFTDTYKTPWGAALNFDQAHSDEVRRYFIDNAVQWIADFHIDGLRLDAVHAIVDPSANPFIEELAAACQSKGRELNRCVAVIAESNRNDRKMVIPRERNGWGLDSQWNDDFHHSLRVSFTGEHEGYYEDFSGVADLAQAMGEGFVYGGQYSKFRKRRYGNSAEGLPGETFVVFAQNHDQVGNRKVGDRLTLVVSFDELKLAAAAVLLSPYVPLLFMGEEYGEPAPFQYFVSHSDPAIIEAVRKGRGEEFADFEWAGELPDPQDEKTFLRSKLDWKLRRQGQHHILLNFYKELLQLRREIPALRILDRNAQEARVVGGGKTVLLRRWHENSEALAVFHFGKQPEALRIPDLSADWSLLLNSASSRWGGSMQNSYGTAEGSGKEEISLVPCSVLLYGKSNR